MQVYSASTLGLSAFFFFQDQSEKEHTLCIIYNISPQSGVKYSEQAATATLIVVSAGA